jgi:hypothetical protein
MIRCGLVLLLACGGAQHAPEQPKVDTAALAAELDAEAAELATILHRDRADCPVLATNLRALFVRMTASFQRAHDLEKDPDVAKRLTSDLERYDAAARKRNAAIDADLTPDAPCVRDPGVRAVLMTMPTL